MPTFMPTPIIPTDYPRIRRVGSFEELAATPFADGVNALCWSRMLAGDFGAVVAGLEAGDKGSAVVKPRADRLGSEDSGIITLDESRLRGLTVSAAGKLAIEAMLADLRLLRELGRDPVLNCIHAYPRDEEPGPVATDVFSFHADSAPVEAETWLCTYHGAPSEGLRNEEARRKVDVPAIRAELLKLYGGADDNAFHAHLHEHCYDLHYAPLPGAQPYSFGVGHLWRIAVDWPGSKVPPCIHRAPATVAGEARLLVIC